MLTAEQRAVLAHVVADPDAWLANAEAALGAEKARAALEAKLARWQPDYDAAKDQPAYKSRAERDAAELAVIPDPPPPQLTVEKLAAMLVDKGIVAAKDVEDAAAVTEIATPLAAPT